MLLADKCTQHSLMPYELSAQPVAPQRDLTVPVCQRCWGWGDASPPTTAGKSEQVLPPQGDVLCAQIAKDLVLHLCVIILHVCVFRIFICLKTHSCLLQWIHLNAISEENFQKLVEHQTAQSWIGSWSKWCYILSNVSFWKEGTKVVLIACGH